ncbi:chaplin [Streptomyces sp. L500]|uniref:Chaplin n=1 Tax=Streptomyces hesseae TaxID=3075519 RepID=A0ABU2SZW2_9ACTN|nr:chaplin [Streptomyces sp. DSM 40473]MDT0453449.1 chaplin [Streptomyces sp. DSM 40473]
MKNIKKAAAVTLAVGGLALAGAGAASAHGAHGAHGVAEKSPGVASGNVVQVPVEVPVNFCGNTIDVVGVLNPAAGNLCVNE